MSVELQEKAPVLQEKLPNVKEKLPIEMVIINKGTQAITKTVEFVDGRKETKTFSPGVPVGCTKIMGEKMLNKFNNDSFAVYFEEVKNAPLVDTIPQAKRGRPKSK